MCHVELRPPIFYFIFTYLYHPVLNYAQYLLFGNLYSRIRFSTPLGNIVVVNPYKIYHKQHCRTNCPHMGYSLVDKKNGISGLPYFLLGYVFVRKVIGTQRKRFSVSLYVNYYPKNKRGKNQMNILFNNKITYYYWHEWGKKNT